MDLRVIVIVIVVFVAALVSQRGPILTTTPAFAAGTQDQSQLVGSIPFIAGGSAHMSQTFTAGLTGGIDQIDLSLGNLLSASSTVTLEVRNVVGGVPGSTVLGSATFSGSSIPLAQATHSFTITPPAPVTAGTQYAIVLGGTLVDLPLVWYGAFGNPYASGNSAPSPDQGATWTPDLTSDLIFKTYVSPLPTATPTVTLTPTATVTSTVTVTPPAEVTATITPTSGPGSPVTSTPTVTVTATAPAQANSPGDDDDDDAGKTKTREQRQQQQHTNQGNRDDVYTEGGVVEVGRDESGAFAVVGNRDGLMVIRLNCRGGCPTIRPGDYIQVEGVKESEGLFYAEEVSIAR